MKRAFVFYLLRIFSYCLLFHSAAHSAAHSDESPLHILQFQEISKGVSPPQRVVSLAPNVTEILFALGLGRLVVGVTRYCNYPKEVLNLPKVGDYSHPSIEKLVALKPDLVIALKEGTDTITSSLKRAQIPFLLLESQRLNDFTKITRQLGKLFAISHASDKLIQTWNHQWLKILNDKSSKSILIQLDHNPLIVAGQDTFLNEVMTRCGFRNVIESSGYPRISNEFLHSKSIDIILVLDNGSLEQTKTSVFSDVQNFWKAAPLTKETIVHYTHNDELSRLGPRLPKAVGELCLQIKNKLRSAKESSSHEI